LPRLQRLLRIQGNREKHLSAPRSRIDSRQRSDKRLRIRHRPEVLLHDEIGFILALPHREILDPTPKRTWEIRVGQLAFIDDFWTRFWW
jgi:hypothetical protein